ncbi:ATP-binding protein [Marinisporobacter balticus]|uniref:Molecular chaperone HtpG n=1 Tax=Marinisporobacter balticus TaxID=2018667 RepID=A0A4R2KEH3_9FIRM|nr:ATP-binding protein [Marinisporobacter balticus]TCO68736.1 molecular chaperone HtpG [Marinisporobacter balticus]
MAVIGKNVIEHLTTAMYENNNIIFREYIQNSADQIDKAIATDILTKGEACIYIDINAKKRTISVYDNATGICKDEFAKKLLSIADSDKDRSEDKGFRGIGRLGGLACCNKLIFASSYQGEPIKSIMVWDAKKLREVINDPKQRPDASNLVDMVTSFEEEKYDKKEHFFEVKLVDVIEENNELLDEKSVRKYLQAVAPVPYQSGFVFRSKIYDYVKDKDFKLDEYKILVNEEQLFKGYTSNLYEGTVEKKTIYDSITDLEFKEFYSTDNELLAWMWFGITKYEKQIPALNKMRGIRLRKENIQVGNSETMSYPRFFKEPRGNYYFVGEIFAVHNALVPNARRDYFNINQTCRIFEEALKPTIYIELYKLYHYANEVKNALTKKAKYVEIQKEFQEKQSSGEFVDEEDKKSAIEKLEKHKVAAESATKKLGLRSSNADENPVYKRVFETLESEYKAEEPKKELIIEEKPEKKYITQTLSKLDKKERKLVSKIYAIIKAILPKDMAEMVVAKIQEELSK